MVQSVRLVCLSVAPFSLCSNHRIIMKFSRVTYNYRRDVLTKGQGKRSKVKVTDRAGVKYVSSNTGTRGETIRFGHDTIRFMIHSWSYDIFHDTFLFLAWKQRPTILACHQENRTPPATAAWAVIMHSGYINGGLFEVSTCWVFV